MQSKIHALVRIDQARGPRPVRRYRPRRVPPPRTLAEPQANTDRHADDIALIAECGDRQAFLRLFEFYAPKITAWMMRRGADPDLAEDIGQETMIRLWRRAGSYDAARAGPSAWIFTIARNVWIDRVRREPRPLTGLDLEVADSDTPERAYQGRERDRRIGEALGGLSEPQALVIRMAFYEGLAHAQIAERLGLPLGTVKSRLRLALAHLRVRLA